MRHFIAIRVHFGQVFLLRSNCTAQILRIGYNLEVAVELVALNVDSTKSSPYVGAPYNARTTVKYAHLTLERLKELLDFDSDTGIFRWKKRPAAKGRARAGDVAGAAKVNQNGRVYRVIGIDSRAYQASQLAFFIHHGRWARGEISPKDGDADNLRPENLVELQTTTNKHDLTTKEGRAYYQKDYWANNAEYRRGLGFKRYYGISYDYYNAVNERQKGLCAICGNPETAVASGKPITLAVDHCHRTGEIRQLLCRSCNSALGHFGDNIERMEKALEYVKFHYTPESVYRGMFHHQGGKCAICKTPGVLYKDGKVREQHAMVVDRDYKTGTVRGLLCADCKEMLTLADDNPETMARMADYIEKDEPVIIDGEPVYLMKKGTR